MVCEGIHSVGSELVSFLDLSIEVVVPCLSITALQSKPLTPLCPTSAHIQSIHESWPKAVAKRVYTLSGKNLASVNQLVSRYTNACAHPLTVSLIENWDPAPVVPVRVTQELARFPFVMRYHPCFKLAYYEALKRVPPPPDLNLVLMPGWRNSLPSLTGIIQSAALNSLKRETGSREGVCFLFSFRFPNLKTNNLREFNINNIVKIFNA